MGSDKVPGMVILRYNGRTYRNAYIITFKVRAHTLAPTILPLLEAPAEDFHWKLPELGGSIRFDVVHGREMYPIEDHFQSREESKFIRRENWRVRRLVDDRNILLGEELLHNKRCVARCAIGMQKILSLFPQNCIAQPLQYLHVEMTNNALSRRYELMVHQTVDITAFRELHKCPSHIKECA
jgi:hypothetical protein